MKAPTYGVWVQDRFSVPDVDAGEDEAFACSSIDFLSSLIGKLGRLAELIGEPHSCRLEPSNEMYVVDMLKLEIGRAHV